MAILTKSDISVMYCECTVVWTSGTRLSVLVAPLLMSEQLLVIHVVVVLLGELFMVASSSGV